MISHSLSYHIMGDVEVELPLKKGIQNWKFQWRVRVLHLALKVVHQLRDDHVVRVCHLVQREDLLNTLDGAHCNVNSLQPCNVFWDWLSFVLTVRALAWLLPPSHYFNEFFGKKNLETVRNWSHNDSLSINIKVKVKWSLYRPGVAQRVGRGIALLFHDRGTRREWVVSSTPRPHFTPGKDPVPILQEAGWAPGSVCTGGKSCPDRDSIPYRPARGQSLSQ